MARKPPEEKGPQAQWIVDQRELRGWKVEQLHAALEKAGYPYTLGTVRGWEAGRPSKPAIRALENVYKAKAPDPHAAPPPSANDMASLIDALSAQTDAITRLAASLEDRQDQSVPLSAVREVVRQIVASAPDLASLGAGRDEPPAPAQSVDAAEDR